MINKLDYVKADIEPNFSKIPMKYAQKFAHRFSYTSVSPIAVVKLREMGRLRSGKGLSMQDQEIAEFLYRNTFATAKQLMDYYEITNKDEFLGRLNYLVTSHVLNMFTLHASDNAKGEFDDALKIYCMDFGAKFLITNYSNQNYYQQICNWFSIQNMVSSQLVAKSLIETQMYISLYKTLKHNDNLAGMVNYIPNREYRDGLDNEKFVMSASLELKDQVLKGNVNSLITDIVYPGEEVTGFRFRVKHLDHIMNGKGDKWKQYFDLSDHKPMFMIILTDPKEQFNYVCKTLYNSTAFDTANVLIATADGVSNGYLDDEGKYFEIKFKKDETNPTTPKIFSKPVTLDWFGRK